MVMIVFLRVNGSNGEKRTIISTHGGADCGTRLVPCVLPKVFHGLYYSGENQGKRKRKRDRSCATSVEIQKICSGTVRVVKEVGGSKSHRSPSQPYPDATWTISNQTSIGTNCAIVPVMAIVIAVVVVAVARASPPFRL
jgi:hypothetical protein